MLRGSISIGAENLANPRLREKPVTEPCKGLKQRSKALSDVKNTLHSNPSKTVTGKDLDQKKTSGQTLKGKPMKVNKPLKNFTILETSENVTKPDDALERDSGCHNHYECEKENSLYYTEFLNEYRLLKEEINYFGDRMNFFGMSPLPLVVNECPSPVEEIEFNEVGRFPDEEEIKEDFSFDIPEPLMARTV